MKNELLSCRLMVVLVAVLFGFESIGVQLCYAYGFSVISLILVRYGLAAFFFGITLAIRKAPVWVPRQFTGRTIILGFLYVASNGLLFASLQYLPAALAILFFYAYPALTALISRFYYDRPLGKVKGVALLLSFLGLILLYWSSYRNVSMLGIACALGAALFGAIKLNLSQQILPHVNACTFSFDMAVMMVLGSIPFALVFGISYHVPGYSWLYVLALGLLVSYLCMLLINLALRKLPAVDVSIICLLEPPVAVLAAFLVFGQGLTGWQFVGAIILLFSVAWPELDSLICERRAIEAGEKQESESTR